MTTNTNAALREKLIDLIAEQLADAILAALSTAARRQQPIWQATELQPRTKSG